MPSDTLFLTSPEDGGEEGPATAPAGLLHKWHDAPRAQKVALLAAVACVLAFAAIVVAHRRTRIVTERAEYTRRMVSTSCSPPQSPKRTAHVAEAEEEDDAEEPNEREATERKRIAMVARALGGKEKGKGSYANLSGATS